MQEKPTRLSCLLIIGCMILLGAVCAFGQDETRAKLAGRVLDATGAVIPHANVSVIADQTGVVRKTTSNGQGDWSVPFLVPGTYHFEVSAQGFKNTVHSSIELQVGDQKFIDIHMEIGADTQTVTVESTTPLVDITSAVSGTVITSEELDELPAETNAPTTMIALSPDVVASTTAGMLWANSSLSTTSIADSGNGKSAINYSIDGGANSTNTSGIAYEPPMNAVSEFRVATNAYDASVGRQSTATINVSMKTGTNLFHGDLYEDNQNNYLNANRYERNASGQNVPRININQFGGGIGGPLWIPKLYDGKFFDPNLYDGRKRKTYFYYTYAGIRNFSPVLNTYLSLPTMAERQGDFSASYTTQTVNGVTTVYPTKIFDPYTWNYDGKGNRQQFAGNIMNRPLDVPAKAIMALLPPPDSAGDGLTSDSNNFLSRATETDHFMGNTLRVDQSWNNRNHSYVSLRNNGFNEISGSFLGKDNLVSNTQYLVRINKGLTIDHTLVLTPQILLDLRYTVVRWEQPITRSGSGYDPTKLGFSQGFADQMQKHAIPQINGVVSVLGTSDSGATTADTNQDIGVSLTQTRGKHNFKYGVQYIIQQEGTKDLSYSGGQFSFSGVWTQGNATQTVGLGNGSSIASFLLGLPTTGSLPRMTDSFWSQHYTGFYFQDDWRKTSRLTLNLGLRWDYELPVTERHNGFFSRYDPTVIQPVTSFGQANYATQILGASTSSNTGIVLLQQFQPQASSLVVTGGNLYAGTHGTSRYVVNPRYRYFQPRVGFAYRLRPGTVVRGGLGRFVQSSFIFGNKDGFNSSSKYIASTDNYDTVDRTWDDPFPNGAGITQPSGSSLGTLTDVGSTTYYVDPNIGRVYVDNATLTIQQQVKDYLFEVSGVYNSTHGLPVNWDINNPSVSEWYAAYTPTINASTGLPPATLPGDYPVPNPYLNVPFVTNGEQAKNSLPAYQLLRPNPLNSEIDLNRATGESYRNALNAKVDRRFHNGFSLIQSFAWGKTISKSTFSGNEIMKKVEKRLSTSDHRFNYVIAPIYELPFGRGKLFGGRTNWKMNELIGGWEVTGQYTFNSGTPLLLPTNSAFFQGSNPSLGSKKTGVEWFDTSKFAMFPANNTPLTGYPAWTGVLSMPGSGYTPSSPTASIQNGVYQDFKTWNTCNQRTFGNIRNPYTTNLDLGVRKAFRFRDGVKLQLRWDAFNALNHPRFGNINVTPGDTAFGAINGTLDPSKRTQVNDPRAIQLSGRIVF